jgi:NADH-quinone oxidoreductase subunit L
MFRLVFLAFHGERRGAIAEAAPSAHGDQHPVHHLHDAPRPMAFALIVLAVGSILAGYIGFPKALGGSGRLERFLAPSFEVAEDVRAEDVRSVRLRPDSADATAAEASDRLELGLMGVSTLAAVGGIGFAMFFFLNGRDRARTVAERFAGLHRVLLHKYYVDEVYDATLVQPIRIVAEQGLWKIVDVRVIDGAVNGVGQSVRGWSELLRRLQTGSVRAYAASLFFGVVVVLGYYLWR